jgi:hypothetical protein
LEDLGLLAGVVEEVIPQVVGMFKHPGTFVRQAAVAIFEQLVQHGQ